MAVESHIESNEGSIRVIQAGEPDASRAVIVLHQAGGLSRQIEFVTDRLAAQGYFAVAPDLFHRKNIGSDFDPMSQFGGDPNAFSRWLEGAPALMRTIDAVMDDLASRGFAHESTAVVGFSYGGYAAFLAALSRPFGASVSWYAPSIAGPTFSANEELQALLPRLEELQTPWLGIFGALDPLTPAEEIAQIQQAITDAPQPADTVVFATVGHAFDESPEWSPRPMEPVDEAVVADAVSQELRWMDEHVAPRT